MWKSKEQEDVWEAVAAENPKRKDESAVHYMERIACLCGGVKREDLLLNRPDTLKSYGERWRAEQNDPRLPYKE